MRCTVLWIVASIPAPHVQPIDPHTEGGRMTRGPHLKSPQDWRVCTESKYKNRTRFALKSVFPVVLIRPGVAMVNGPKDKQLRQLSVMIRHCNNGECAVHPESSSNTNHFLRRSIDEVSVAAIPVATVGLSTNRSMMAGSRQRPGDTFHTSGALVSRRFRPTAPEPMVMLGSGRNHRLSNEKMRSSSATPHQEDRG
jgi:hypothetical protein